MVERKRKSYSARMGRGGEGNKRKIRMDIVCRKSVIECEKSAL